ncbi:MAG: Asp-tRNA(Asn)/Glu-tRNA(Gln) amidotransferase subunit GatC [Furfurilactobacillus sp.]|uniref:Aspartyl/glutamyl-tRNA(Asn/Gln) amidotransferase subunit C n=2 Tax=Furfurilactobacillus TaxID=2767882 RepID=A0A6N9I055_9LACO|nr:MULTISPECIES: Asp-tRNA(Asn)/Glu-tRNA(Gln) amidotransferase subunit GatC [Furfurilactobacillus]MCF6165316.1 Asp-tRNA(Asn)/Glu-tRNA(Gln) amidotransferase subunit GatC [Furfurilactobacillus rossiae]MCF6419726.1 Asp-tRNA(Asn)/Glu-tRNA(Gln) amidotransferase subunit GatC [Furfurilactobacillus milii]MCH4012630.1 Asp-tRNA(Asn)/Glu-tRNA(Gln) amidotransferase subunit GatC [Furfurilactobacillus sp.]MCH4036213.1 Asp-tRNA(Asn)/Glu-tRNA(Gln) amidotransferase subunit GatC [Furfurilactobacillus sp.]MCH4114
MAEEPISRAEVEHVAELAKLSLTDEQASKFTSQLDEIITMIDGLNEVNTDDVKPTTNMADATAILREDVAVNAHQKDALINEAPETEDGFIKVPAIIDESEDA